MKAVPQLLKEKEVAQLLGLHVQTLRNQRFAGTGLPYIKLGRAVRYDSEDVNNRLDQCRIMPRADKS